MLNQLPTMLAITMQDLIVYGVILIMVIGGAIANQAKQTKETQQNRVRRSRDRAMGGEPSSAPSLDEIAQQRRRQLEALARQRRGGRAGAGAPQVQAPPPPPVASRRTTNVSEQNPRMADLAQEQASTRRSHDAAARREKEAADFGQRQRDAEDRLRQQQRQTQPQRSAQARVGDGQSRLQKPRSTRRPPSRPQPPPIAQAPPQPGVANRATDYSIASTRLGEGVTQVDDLHDDVYGESHVHRHVHDAPVESTAIRHSRLGNLSRQSLRQAIILRELLDQPLALRKPDEMSDPFAA